MKQMALTPAQHEVLGRLEAVLREAKGKDIGFVYDIDSGTVTAYNNANSPEQYAGRNKENDSDEEMDFDLCSPVENVSMDYFDSGMQGYFMKF